MPQWHNYTIFADILGLFLHFYIALNPISFPGPEYTNAGIFETVPSSFIMTTAECLPPMYPESFGLLNTYVIIFASFMPLRHIYCRKTHVQNFPTLRSRVIWGFCGEFRLEIVLFSGVPGHRNRQVLRPALKWVNR